MTPINNKKNDKLDITAMKNPPKEVIDIVLFEQAISCSTNNYEWLSLIAWVQASNLFDARRVLDRYYQIITKQNGKGLWNTTCLADGVCNMSRGNPVELHVGDWWILCGFNFD